MRIARQLFQKLRLHFSHSRFLSAYSYREAFYGADEPFTPGRR